MIQGWLMRVRRGMGSRWSLHRLSFIHECTQRRDPEAKDLLILEGQVKGLSHIKPTPSEEEGEWQRLASPSGGRGSTG